MIDLTKVRNYYIACGYTDLRLGIDGLAAVVTQQYGSHLDEESLFLFCGRRTDRTLGRKNWLFCDTTKRAEASAIVYSLVESAKATVLNLLLISSMCWWSCRTWEKTNPTKNWNRSCLGHPMSNRNSV